MNWDLVIWVLAIAGIASLMTYVIHRAVTGQGRTFERMACPYCGKTNLVDTTGVVDEYRNPQHTCKRCRRVFQVIATITFGLNDIINKNKRG